MEINKFISKIKDAIQVSPKMRKVEISDFIEIGMIMHFKKFDNFIYFYYLYLMIFGYIRVSTDKQTVENQRFLFRVLLFNSNFYHLAF